MHSLIHFLSAISRLISSMESTIEGEPIDVTSFLDVGVDNRCNLGSSSRLLFLE